MAVMMAHAGCPCRGRAISFTGHRYDAAMAPRQFGSFMKFGAHILGLVLGLLACPGQSAPLQLSPEDQMAAFQAAGFKREGGRWVSCSRGEISEVRDINGDGLPDALILESGTFCFGVTAQHFSLVSKSANGKWRLIHESIGIANFLPQPKRTGWPDLLIGGPGFCFPVLRWNGQRYAADRYEYDGKACQSG